MVFICFHGVYEPANITGGKLPVAVQHLQRLGSTWNPSDPEATTDLQPFEAQFLRTLISEAHSLRKPFQKLALQRKRDGHGSGPWK